MRNIERDIGLRHGDLCAELAVATQYMLFTHLGVTIEITDIGSGDVTEAIYKGVHYPECHYGYSFTDGTLTGISLELTASDGKQTFKAPVTSEICRLYEQIMLTSHLLSECRKLTLLNHEEMGHSENWEDAADIVPLNDKGGAR